MRWDISQTCSPTWPSTRCEVSFSIALLPTECALKSARNLVLDSMRAFFLAVQVNLRALSHRGMTSVGSTSMKRFPLVVALSGALTACGDDGGPSDAGAGGGDFSLMVTGRPAVRDVARIAITETANGLMRTDDFPVTSLPATIPYLLPKQPIAWSVRVEAYTTTDELVGLGSADIPASAVAVDVMLEPADFVVNTTTSGDQFLTTDYEAVGLQIAASTAGVFTVAFRDDCAGNTSSCDIYARRFDSSGDPQGALYSASSNKTTTGAQPAIATLTSGTSLVVWDFTTPGSGNRGVACRAIGVDGTLSPAQLTIATEAADVVSVTALSNGNAAITWLLFQSPTYVLRGVRVKPDCTVIAPPFTVSSTAPSTGAVDGRLSSLRSDPDGRSAG
jgi:hypothetical protein